MEDYQIKQMFEQAAIAMNMITSQLSPLVQLTIWRESVALLPEAERQQIARITIERLSSIIVKGTVDREAAAMIVGLFKDLKPTVSDSLRNIVGDALAERVALMLAARPDELAKMEIAQNSELTAAIKDKAKWLIDPLIIERGSEIEEAIKKTVSEKALGEAVDRVANEYVSELRAKLMAKQQGAG